MTKVLWVPRSRNTKTGDIPQGYIGTKEEARHSCLGCPMLENECYHWKGTSGMAHSAITKGYLKNPQRYTLQNAFNNSARNAQYIRLAVGGDPCVLTRSQVAELHQQAIEEGFKGVLGYTHFPKTKGKHLRGLVLASCNLKQSDELLSLGWRVAIDLPFRAPGVKRHQHLPEWDGEPITTPAGHPINICDAQTTKTVTCNSCGKCNPFDLRYTRAIGWLIH